MRSPRDSRATTVIPSSCVLATEAVRRRPSLASSTSSAAAVVALHVPLTIHEARMRRWWSLAPTHWPRRQFVRQSHQYRFSNGPPSTTRAWAHQGTALHDVARRPTVPCLVVPSCPTISPNTAPMGTQQCVPCPRARRATVPPHARSKLHRASLKRPSCPSRRHRRRCCCRSRLRACTHTASMECTSRKGHPPPPLRAPTCGDAPHRHVVGLSGVAVVGTRAPLALQAQFGRGREWSVGTTASTR